MTRQRAERAFSAKQNRDANNEEAPARRKIDIECVLHIYASVHGVSSLGQWPKEIKGRCCFEIRQFDT